MSDEELEQQRKTDLKRIRDAVAALSEHFDSVHIFTTRDDGSETGTFTGQFGSGNWFTRYGQIRMWVDKQLCYEQKAINEEPPDES